MILEAMRSYPNVTAAIIFTLISIPISVCDLRSLKIPDFLNILLFLLLLAHRFLFSRGDFIIYLTCSICSLLLFYLVRRISRMGLGWGDIKYSPSCALASGIWCFPAFLASSIFCALYFFIVKLKNKSVKTEKAPFAPFMALGTITLCSIPIVQDLLN